MKRAVSILVLSIGLLAARAGEPVPVVRSFPPLSIRGINYMPAATPWGGMWTKTPDEVWAQDLALVASLKANTVRIFVDSGDTNRLARLETFLAMAWSNNLRCIVSFNPHEILYPRKDDGDWRRHYEAIVKPHANDGRVLMWELMNEPDDPAKWNDRTKQYLVDARALVRNLDTNHLTTIGLTWRLDVLPDEALPDVLQYHEYGPVLSEGGDRVGVIADRFRKRGGSRPVFIGEFGVPTARDPQFGAPTNWTHRIGKASRTEADQAEVFRRVLAAAEKFNLAGVAPWCLHSYEIRPTGFVGADEGMFGIVRRDGTLKPAATVLRERYAAWVAGHPSP